ncbi:MAG: Trk family potassium uptake protein [Clostridiaceae bacterium]|nr:Trk family potassium uptake protein [Clostridiaceae bacterium]
MLVRKSKSKEFFRWLLSKPARMIVGSFLLIIMMGFVLLLLPLSSADGRSVGPLKAIFTSVSATCVTGLVLSDTALTYSSFGRSVVIGLIQIGGLGLVTITTFFLTIVRRRVGLKTRLLAQESSGSFTFMELPSLLKSIVVMTLSFELLGMLVFATQFVPLFGWRAGLSKSAFHAVSSFCNAGFDLMGDTSFGPYSSMTGFADNPVVLLMTSFLIISGGLGFIVWRDIFAAINSKKLHVHSRITLLGTGILLIVGTAFFLMAEFSNTSEGAMGLLAAGDRLSNAFFQSVTMRTAGFNSINMTTMIDSSKVISVMLMFIGAGSGSTGGGVKVSTFMLLLYSMHAEIKGDTNIVIRKNQIPREAVQRAIAILVMAMGLVLFLSILLSFAEAEALDLGQMSYLDLLFESASAFGTVGVSSANTPVLSTLSKILIIPVMFIGRIGPVTFAVSLALREPKEYSNVFPEGRIHIG